MRDRIVVIGGAGFLGRALRRRLGERYSLTSVDRAWDAASDVRPPYERRIVMDAADPREIDELLAELQQEGRRLAGVVYLAAYYDFLNKPDPRYGKLEFGLEYLLREAGRRLPAHAPFVYAGSMTTLRPVEPGQVLTEDSPRWGPWAYPAHKLRCEEIIEAAEVPQARCQLVFAGVYSEWCELVPLYFQLERARGSGPSSALYPGATDRGLTYVHVEDTASAIERALETKRGGEGQSRYLIGETAPYTYAEIDSAAREAFGQKPRALIQVPKFLAKAGASVLSAVGSEDFVRPWMVDYADEHFAFDVSRAATDLQWRPSRHISDVLPEMCHRADHRRREWTKKNQARPR